LMVSFGNAGFALGSFLGGIIITGFGVHNVIWISIGLLAVTLGLSFVHIKKRATKVSVSGSEPTTSVEVKAAVAA